MREAREAGACGVWANLLNLRPGTREHFLGALAADFPDQLERYESLYARRAYLGAEQVRPIVTQVAALARRHGIRDRREKPTPSERLQVHEQLALGL